MTVPISPERPATLLIISRSTDATCPLVNLPEDIVLSCILPILDPITLLRFSLGCRRLYEVGTLEMEIRCRKAGFTHPRGEHAWDVRRSPARSRRMSPYTKRSPRKPMSPSAHLLAGMQRSPLSGPVINARLPPPPICRSNSFIDRLKAAGGADPSSLVVKEEQTMEPLQETMMNNPFDCNSRRPSPNVTPKKIKQQSGKAAKPPLPSPASKRSKFLNSPGMDFGLPEELAARVRKQEYYRRKFYEKFLTPLCCLCWGVNGSGRPHPFFSNRPVCYTCFCQTKYVLSGFEDFKSPKFRYIETVVSSFQVCNYRFPASWIHERTERIITLSVNFRASMARSLRTKYNKYLSHQNRYLSLHNPSHFEPVDEHQKASFSEINEPDSEQCDLISHASTPDEESKNHPGIDGLNKHKDEEQVTCNLSPEEIVVKEKARYDKARADLYRFYYSEIYPLAKRAKGAEKLLEQAVPLLKNENLWRKH